MIDRALSAYLKQLPVDSGHPFLSYRPTRWRLHAWATRVRAMEEQEHHYHQHGWISGVYYVNVPSEVGADGSGMAGFIEFCRFQQFSDRDVKSEFAAVKPEPGLMVLFPAYFYHRIVPFRSADLRISVAFNVIPLS